MYIQQQLFGVRLYTLTVCDEYILQMFSVNLDMMTVVGNPALLIMTVMLVKMNICGDLIPCGLLV